MSTSRSLLAISLAVFASAPLVAKTKAVSQKSNDAPAILWSKPGDIARRNLLYGAGGKENQPHGPFIFMSEDIEGTNPKFDVRDADGVKWKAKLGVEAQAETAATRLVWAVGYYTNEDYLVPDFRVNNLPARLKRGNGFRKPDGSFENVRLKRSIKGMDKIASWKWRDNPFSTTRELDGLRVMMALLNNWDLKTENNGVFEWAFGGRPALIHMVTDLGASFGGNSLGLTHAASKDNVNTFQHSRFIAKTTTQYVSFATPGQPTLLRIFIPTEFFSRIGMEKIGKRIPIEHARWIGQQLAQLTPDQIRDAFRAANYSAAEIETFTAVVRARIAELNKL